MEGKAIEMLELIEEFINDHGQWFVFLEWAAKRREVSEDEIEAEFNTALGRED